MYMFTGFIAELLCRVEGVGMDAIVEKIMSKSCEGHFQKLCVMLVR
jgi:hypothetical protein